MSGKLFELIKEPNPPPLPKTKHRQTGRQITG